MINNLIRPNIVKMKPYVCARDLYQEGVFMDANENAFCSPVKNSRLLNLNRYPDPSSTELKKALGRYVGVDFENIFVSSGSDEIIDLLIRLFVNEDEEVLIFEPTYGMYRVLAEVNNVRIKTCSLGNDFQINFTGFRDALSAKTKIVFLCSPNNPTGNLLNYEDILKIVEKFNGVVVVDEAYVEFSSRESLAKVAVNSENLIILRTLSKAWGLAGIRVGYCLANKLIIDYLNKIKLPYNVNLLSSYMAIKALKNSDLMEQMVLEIIAERNWLRMELKKLGFKVFASEANFLLVKIVGAGRIVKKLAEDFGIIVRDFSNKPGVPEDCFRITVGTSKQNRALIQALTLIL